MNRPIVCGVLVGLLGLHAQGGMADSCDGLFEKLNERHARVASGTPLPGQGTRSEMLHALEGQLFEVLARCPTDAELFALMGEVQISMGRLPLAEAYGRKAVQLNARSWRAQQLLGSTLAMRGRPAEGITHLERAVELEPGNPRLRLNLASALLTAKQYVRAREICDGLVASGEAGIAASAHNLRGQVHLRQGELSEAGRDFAAAEKLGFDARRGLLDVENLKRQRNDDGRPAQARER